MNRIKELNMFTKTSLCLGILLLTYGILSRIIPIYFFWESKPIGLGLTSIGLIGLLFKEIKSQNASIKETTLDKIGIGISSFIFILFASVIFLLNNSDACKASKKYIINSEEIKSEVGEINGFGTFLSGEFSTQTNSEGQKGNASFNLIIKGDKAYKSVTVIVLKEYGKDWEVQSVD